MLSYVYVHNMGWAWGLLMFVVLFALLAALVRGAVPYPRDRQRESPGEILDRRFASGKIDKVEYERARQAIAGTFPPSPPEAT